MGHPGDHGVPVARRRRKRWINLGCEWGQRGMQRDGRGGRKRVVGGGREPGGAVDMPSGETLAALTRLRKGVSDPF